MDLLPMLYYCVVLNSGGGRTGAYFENQTFEFQTGGGFSNSNFILNFQTSNYRYLPDYLSQIRSAATTKPSISSAPQRQ